MAVYSPEVVLLRGPVESGRGAFLPEGARPKVSVVTVAARGRRRQRGVPWHGGDPCGYHDPLGPYDDGGENFKGDDLRDQMRLVLRVAALHGHSRLFLADFGGAFAADDGGEVSRQFVEVALEDEFAGARWEDVAFYVPEKYEIHDTGGKDYFDLGDGGVDEAELSVVGMGLTHNSTMAHFLEGHLV
jgi:hypothetical protein